MVGEKTVSKEELQAIAMRFKVGLKGAAEDLGMTSDRIVNLMIENLEEVMKSVLYSNNILEWDWSEAVGESYLPEFMDTGNLQGDKFFYPKRWSWEPRLLRSARKDFSTTNGHGLPLNFLIPRQRWLNYRAVLNQTFL